MAIVVLALFAMMPAGAAAAGAESLSAANPVRRVVTMLEDMVHKVQEEGAQEAKLYDKQGCYCETGGANLKASVAAAETKIPELESQLKEAESNHQVTTETLAKQKAEREAENSAMANLKSVRANEASKFAAMKERSELDLKALAQAIALITHGLGQGQAPEALLQTAEMQALQKLVAENKQKLDSDVVDAVALLAKPEGQDVGEILGVLKQIQDRMTEELAQATKDEEAAIAEFKGLITTKIATVNSLSKSIEAKLARAGELAVDIVRIKEDLQDTREAYGEDKTYLADLDQMCANRKKEWEERSRTRLEELRALKETIAILSDDDALELFKKVLPSPAASFMQVTESTAQLKRSALRMLRDARQMHMSDNTNLDFIGMAIRGDTRGFGHVQEMINDMIENLAKTQRSDDDKKAWCLDKLSAGAGAKAEFERSIADFSAEMEQVKTALATLKDELKALASSIAALDKSVAEATEQRKAENAEYTNAQAQNVASKQLLEFAKNRLHQFYNPKLHKAAKKEELSRAGRIFDSHSASFVQVARHKQTGEVAPPPPPEAFGAYAKKAEESNGVLAMIDLLIKDLDTDASQSKVEEKNSQADYEEAMTDASKKRAISVKEVTAKTNAQAELTDHLQTVSDKRASMQDKLKAKEEALGSLHKECDWLLQNSEARKEARAGEVDALKKAKAILSGADFN